ncbi:hypothetical protein [Chitinimonas taiwanensis]|uniref:hypothetical protein n=1 Tax=Chitinimonas taiwanensis TaxID=240412 RepID=UPI00093204A0|nr:hypothetical protein [Chitinimonas taiwanensis]
MYMSISETLKAAFPEALGDPCVTAAFIESNTDLMGIKEQFDLLALVPTYMHWCTTSNDRASLVFDGTLHALAEYGRCKSPEIRHLNFRHQCSPAQKAAVLDFLEWCKSEEIMLNEQQLSRALRNWAQDD